MGRGLPSQSWFLGSKETGMTKRKREVPCLHCGKLFSKHGVYEHERHHCPKNPERRKRSFGKTKCKICGEIYHAAGLRAHMATQHPAEFAREEANRKPSSRAAKRRELMRSHSGAHRAKRPATVRQHARPHSNPPTKQKTAQPHHRSKETPAPLESKQPRLKTAWSDPRHPENRGRSRPSRDAWGEMEREVARAAAELPPGNARRKDMR